MKILNEILKTTLLKFNEIKQKLSKAIRIFFLFQKQLLSKQLSYRLSTLLSSSWLLIWVFVDFFFFKSIFGQSADIAGWSYWDCILLMLALSIFWDIFWRIASGGLYQIPRKIFKGDLDQFLIKPFNEILLLNWSGFNTNQSLNTLIIAFYYISNRGFSFTLVQFLQFLVTITLAVGIFSWIFLLIASAAFWIDDTALLASVFWQVLNISRYPKGVFKGILANVFTLILPILFVANLPVNFLRGEGDWIYLPQALGLNIILGWVALSIWKKGLKRYSGLGN